MQDQPIMIISVKNKCAQSVPTTSSDGRICSNASYSDNGDGSNADCSGDERCGATADADIIVSDDTDGEDNENISSSNEPGDDSDSAESSEDNDNSDKDTTILIPTYVNTPDYDDVCATEVGKGTLPQILSIYEKASLQVRS